MYNLKAGSAKELNWIWKNPVLPELKKKAGYRLFEA
jgi:hypothetical protein